MSPATPPRGRLAVRIYLYSLFCTVLAVALFVLVAWWMRPPRPIHSRDRDRDGAAFDDIAGPPLGAGHGHDRRRHHHRDPSAIPDGPPPPPPPMPLAPPPHGIPTDLFVITGLALIAVVLVISGAFARSLVRPLQRLAGAADAFGRGDHGARAALGREDEIGAAGRAFDEMAERTTLLMRSQREMMANVSHELRTPLARMRVALDLAAEGDAGTAREVMTDIEQDLGELEGLVDDVLTSMRLDMVSAPLRLESLDLADVVHRAASHFRALPAAASRLRVQLPDNLPAFQGDPVLLRRVLDNLLDNARKYSEPATAIDLRVSSDPTSILIEVEDRGMGIAAADLAHIFTPFFRADRSRQRGTGGVGLGLSLAHKIVSAHRGTLTATSTEGHGTILRLTLPLTPAPILTPAVS